MTQDRHRPTSPRKRAPHPSRRSRDASEPRPLREDLVAQAALEAYALVHREGRLADRALDFTLRKKTHLYSTERRAVAEQVYALLRRQLTVDWLLRRTATGFETRGTSEKDLLRLCASRVLHGEEPGVVSRAVHLRPADALALDHLPEAAASLEQLPVKERFPVAASLPDFLAERFRSEFGDEAEAAAEAMNERAPLNARVNTLKSDRESLLTELRGEGVECQPTLLSPLGIQLDTRINAFSLATFKAGKFELQDEGSQLLGMLVDPPPTHIVDACAGAGGKALQLAAAMKNRGELFALDVDTGRLEELRRRARRDGVHNIRDRIIPREGPDAALALEALRGKADRVLVDAPCSGSGTFRRKPDARYRLTPESLGEHVLRQRRLLAQFSTLVKGGGWLVYGTCSVFREENEDVVQNFLQGHPNFAVKPIEQSLGAELGARVSRDGFLRLSPHRHGTDGFFGAILVRSR